MQYLKETLDVVFDGLTDKDYDTLWIIAGDEGTGKSHLALHIMEYWYEKLRGDVCKDDIKHIGLDREQFVEDLKNCKKYELTVFDEAGDISSKRVMSKFNVMLTQAYQVIRGDNLFTILVLPSIFDLDSFFTKRRARALIQVYKRGRCAFWSRGRLRKIIEVNQNRMIKRVWNVNPCYYDSYPKYKGKLMEGYQEKKAEKMKEIRKELWEAVKAMKGDDNEMKISERDKMIVKMKKAIGTGKTAEIAGLSTRQILNISKKAQEIRSG